MENTLQNDGTTGGPTSGFTKDISQEMDETEALSNEFHGLEERYVSSYGHARLFSATRYGKRYMLKCLKTDFLYIPVYKQALNKEFEIGLQLDHPHICRTFSKEHVPGLGACIVMEYVDGKTLQEMLADGQMPAPLAQKVARQLMEALEYLHSKQIIHRDLKPSNIMVTHNGHDVKLIDFSLSDSDAFSILKTPAGTAGYIAPEQLLAAAKSDVRADIYSLGMVLEDMAKATDNSRLHALAMRCACRDVRRRPATIEQVRHASVTNPLHTITVIILAVISLFLAAVIALSFLKSDNTNEASDGNQVKEWSISE